MVRNPKDELQAAIEGRIMDGLEIPVASRAKRGERTVAVPVHTALKAALYLTMRERGITRVRWRRMAAEPGRWADNVPVNREQSDR